MQQFKVYFEREGEQEVRRYNLNEPVGNVYNVVQQKIAAVLGHANFRLTWKDSDGDSIVCNNEDDLQVAFLVNESVKKQVLCLYVKTLAPPPAPLEGRQFGYLGGVASAPHGVEKHCHVLCDGCDCEVLGTRYKCVVCPDFDLCVKCESLGKHRQHDAVAIRKPDNMDWRKLFAARESVYGRSRFMNQQSHTQTTTHHTDGSSRHTDGPTRHTDGPTRHTDGPTVELDLNLNQPLESLLRDVNAQVQKVLKGFMPQILAEPLVKPSAEPSAGPLAEPLVGSVQETLTETVVMQNVPFVEVRENQVEVLHEIVTEQGSTKQPEETAAVESVCPHLLHTATEEAAVISVAEQRHSPCPPSPLAPFSPTEGNLEESGDEGDWALVSDTESVTPTTKDAVTETLAKDSPSSQIEAALDAMSEMGFKNEGNLLRALLENFHGDIGKVLDTINQ